MTPDSSCQARRWATTGSGNCRLHVREDGSGAPLVMIHGWPFDCRLFGPQMQQLSAQFHTIAYDRRGFGESTGLPGLHLEAQDLADLLDVLGLESAHVLGMSQGGRIALRFAAKFPGRTRSLVLQGAAIDGWKPAAGSTDSVPLARYVELARRGELELVRQEWLRHPLVSIQEESEPVRALIRDMVESYEGRDLLNFDAKHYRYQADVVASIRQHEIPLLLLTGAREAGGRREQARHLRREIPGSREVIFKNSAHFCNLSEPKEYNREVAEFSLDVEESRKRSVRSAHD